MYIEIYLCVNVWDFFVNIMRTFGVCKIQLSRSNKWILVTELVRVFGCEIASVFFVFVFSKNYISLNIFLRNVPAASSLKKMFSWFWHSVCPRVFFCFFLFVCLIFFFVCLIFFCRFFFFFFFLLFVFSVQISLSSLSP